MGSPGGSGAVGITPAARALQRREPLPMRAGQAPEPTPSDDVKKKDLSIGEKTSMMGRPAGSRAALFLLLIATCDVQSAAQARSRVLGPTAATCVAAIGSAPPVPSAFSTSPVPSAFPNCDSPAHLASVTSVTCDGGSVLGQFALECTNSTESPLGSPLAPSLRLGGGSASVTIGSPAGIPLFSEAGDVLVAWEWNGRGGGVAMVVAVMVMVVMMMISDRVVGGTSDVHCASSCAAPVLFGSRWVGSTGSATSSSGGDFLQLVGTRMYRECMGETGAGLPARQPQPSSAEQHYCGSCSSTAAGGLETSCQDTDTPSTPASVLPRAA